MPNSPWLPTASRRTSTTVSWTGGHCRHRPLPTSPTSSSPRSAHCSHLGCLLSLKHPALLSATGPLHIPFLLPKMYFPHSSPLPSLPQQTPKELSLVSNFLPSKMSSWDFPGGPVDKNLPAKAGDTGSIPGLGRFHRQWNH